MNPMCVPLGTTSRQPPALGKRTTACQCLGATRVSGISKPSRGIEARADVAPPVIVPTTSNQSQAGATAISRSQSLWGTTQPVRMSTVNA